MPLFENNQPNPETKPTNNNDFDNQTNPPNNQTQPKPNSLITTLGQLLPLAPFVYEQFTGQKVPQMTGTMAEIQTALLQIQSGMQTIVNHQNSLNQKLIALETTAAQQFTNLIQQVQSFKLTHTKEKKEIDFNHPPKNQ